MNSYLLHAITSRPRQLTAIIPQTTSLLPTILTQLEPPSGNRGMIDPEPTLSYVLHGIPMIYVNEADFLRTPPPSQQTATNGNAPKYRLSQEPANAPSVNTSAIQPWSARIKFAAHIAAKTALHAPSTALSATKSSHPNILYYYARTAMATTQHMTGRAPRCRHSSTGIESGKHGTGISDSGFSPFRTISLPRTFSSV